MHNQPYEPMMRAWLIRLIEEFQRHTGAAETSVCVKICGSNGTLLSDLKGGDKSFSAFAFDRAIGNLSDKWPSDVPWPSDIPRFSSSAVRQKARRPKS